MSQYPQVFSTDLHRSLMSEYPKCSEQISTGFHVKVSPGFYYRSPQVSMSQYLQVFTTDLHRSPCRSIPTCCTDAPQSQKWRTKRPDHVVHTCTTNQNGGVHLVYPYSALAKTTLSTFSAEVLSISKCFSK
jgi:hypothetical protein